APHGKHAALGAVQPRPPDLRRTQACRYRKIVRAALTLNRWSICRSARNNLTHGRLRFERFQKFGNLMILERKRPKKGFDNPVLDNFRIVKDRIRRWYALAGSDTKRIICTVVRDLNHSCDL